MKYPCRLKSEPGSSLLELLAYTAVLTIMLSTSAVAMRGYFKQMTLRAELYRMERKIIFLRSFAVHSGCTTFLSITEEPIEYFLGSECDQSLLSGELPLSNKIDFHSNQSIYRFYPSGVATPGRIELSVGGSSCSLVLSLRGRIRSECSYA